VAGIAKGQISIHDGLHYKRKTNDTVNAGFSMEFMATYSALWPPGQCPDKIEPLSEPPYMSVHDFVNTLRQNTIDSPYFEWPCQKHMFNRALAVALHHCPVGYMVTIKNGLPITDRFVNPETGTVEAFVLDMYHGTSAMRAPYILREGFRPVLGAGSDALLAHYEVLVPCVYVGKSWKVAAQYPIERTTLALPSISKSGVGGAPRLTMDGTPPVRCVFRFLADTTQHAWHKDSNQSGFLADTDAYHITHVTFYPVAPILEHKASLGMQVSCHPVDAGRVIPEHAAMQEVDRNLVVQVKNIREGRLPCGPAGAGYRPSGRQPALGGAPRKPTG
jgi:hypothetical protein